MAVRRHPCVCVCMYVDTAAGAPFEWGEPKRQGKRNDHLDRDSLFYYETVVVVTPLMECTEPTKLACM